MYFSFPLLLSRSYIPIHVAHMNLLFFLKDIWTLFHTKFMVVVRTVWDFYPTHTAVFCEASVWRPPPLPLTFSLPALPAPRLPLCLEPPVLLWPRGCWARMGSGFAAGKCRQQAGTAPSPTRKEPPQSHRAVGDLCCSVKGARCEGQAGQGGSSTGLKAKLTVKFCTVESAAVSREFYCHLSFLSCIQ